jgi:hypothetical protein
MSDKDISGKEIWTRFLDVSGISQTVTVNKRRMISLAPHGGRLYSSREGPTNAEKGQRRGNALLPLPDLPQCLRTGCERMPDLPRGRRGGSPALGSQGTAASQGRGRADNGDHRTTPNAARGILNRQRTERAQERQANNEEMIHLSAAAE